MNETSDLERHYVTGLERKRLFSDDGTARLELVRSLELLRRFLPPAPATFSTSAAARGRMRRCSRRTATG
jgi:hypothetical protein